MKTLKSCCGNIWLFDVEIDDISIRAGLACFLTSCPATAQFVLNGSNVKVGLPLQAIDNVVPMRVANARLFLQ